MATFNYHMEGQHSESDRDIVTMALKDARAHHKALCDELEQTEHGIRLLLAVLSTESTVRAA